MLCETHVWPLYGSPVQLFHAHCTDDPADTVREVGVNALFVTATPPGGGGVFTFCICGLVEPPPHPNRHAIATAVKACFNILSPSSDSAYAMLPRGRYWGAPAGSSSFPDVYGGRLQGVGEGIIGRRESQVPRARLRYAASCMVFSSMIFKRRVTAGSLSTTVSPTLLPTSVLPMGDDMLTWPSSNSTESPNTRL